MMIGVFLVNIQQIEIAQSKYSTKWKVFVQLKAVNFNNSVCRHERGPGSSWRSFLDI